MTSSFFAADDDDAELQPELNFERGTLRCPLKNDKNVEKELKRKESMEREEQQTHWIVDEAEQVLGGKLERGHCELHIHDKGSKEVENRIHFPKDSALNKAIKTIEAKEAYPPWHRRQGGGSSAARSSASEGTGEGMNEIFSNPAGSRS